MFRKLAIVAVLMLALGQNAQGDTMDAYVSGNEILSDCQSGETMLQALCVGYIVGSYDGMRAASNLDPAYDDQMRVCIPFRITRTQLRDIVIQFLKNNPEIRHWPASLLVHGAIIENFECE